MKYTLVFTGIMLLTMAIMVGALLEWHGRIKKRSRPPLDFKLLRGPGETLRKKLQKLDEQMWPFLAVASTAPFVVGSLVAGGIDYLWPNRAVLALGGWVVVYAIGTAFACKAFIKSAIQMRNWRLGYLGERLVGEHLAPLQQEGFHIFHDVPAENGDRKFNIDHVVVGRPGVFVIETKARRKGNARPGFKDHEVVFDGKQLIWPWGEESRSLKQAVNLARWTDEWFHKMTGLTITSEPILAIPGWYVIEKAKSSPRVQNPKNLASAIRGLKRQVLSADQIELLVRQLDARCRDVED